MDKDQKYQLSMVEEVVILTTVEAMAVDVVLEVKDAVVEEEEDGLVDTGEVVDIKRDSITHMLCQGCITHLFQRQGTIRLKNGTF